MKTVLKWLGIVAGSLVGLVVLAAGYVFIASETVIARTYEVPRQHFQAPADVASVSRGERIATISGCGGCHGAQLEGTIMFDEPNIARVAAPNLTQLAQEYSDADFERAIRHGVRPDGKSVWIMPSAMYSHLTDEDLGALISWVRSKPAREGVGRERIMRALGRIGIVTEKFTPVATEVGSGASRKAPDYSDPVSHGRYLVMTACTECHGQNLQGNDFLRAPNLLIAAAYSEADFTRLMRTGRGLGDRDLGLMSKSASRFSTFTDQELQAIRTYLALYAQQGGNAAP
jgi:cytochrome c553